MHLTSKEPDIPISPQTMANLLQIGTWTHLVEINKQNNSIHAQALTTSIATFCTKNYCADYNALSAGSVALLLLATTLIF